MSKEITGSYNPKEVEEKIYKIWEESGYFNPGKLPARHKKSYCVTIAPVNITGSLHMGHALENTMIDILIRKKRMEGRKVLWLPGTDHAGIATQNVVEKKLKKEGLSRHDLGREKFVEKIWEWKKEYGNKILDQMKKLGFSCDWSRARFTMDENYQKAVKEAFLHYYKKGWVYQAERVINWCPRCQTSLSDLELEYKEEKGKLYWLKYGPFTLATTRPETKLGDTAVAVHPDDKRYKEMVGREYEIPGVLGKFKIKVVADRVVDPNFGSGAVKVTPAHSIVDSEIAERHNIPAKKIIDKFGKMMENCGKYAGLKTSAAREKIVEDMKKMDLIDHIDENYTHNLATCYRCNNVIENIPSLQWFLKMDKLAGSAVKIVKNKKINFHPKKWEKIYLDWLSNIKDWCVSRQIWWGHKIPIDGSEDVLDTWFSSALWPFATLGWPEKTEDFRNFYPTNLITSGRDILHLWITRMIFSGAEFTKKEPFKEVTIHPTILTKTGKRMSKSLGTGIDPMNYIEKYGADATRFGLIWQMMGNQDIHWAEEHVLAGKKFCNKIWNAARFVLMSTDKAVEEYDHRKKLRQKKLTEADKAIIQHLLSLKDKVGQNIDKYNFGLVLHELYSFFWHDFCDIYLESSKKQLENDNLKENTQEILSYVLITSLKLLHPFMPFITEEIWSKLPAQKGLLIIENYPSK